MKRDGMVYTVVFTFLICAAFVFFLALANMLTADRVAANRRLSERTAVLSALGIPLSDEVKDDAAAVDKVYDGQVTKADSPSGTLYTATVDGQVRWAEAFAGPGLWGTIAGILAVNSDVTRIEGLSIVSHNETPGLGGRIEERWFKDQFFGEKIGASGIRVRQGSGKGDKDKDNSELDAVTGASRTSQAIQDIVNGQIARFRDAAAGGYLK